MSAAKCHYQCMSLYLVDLYIEFVLESLIVLKRSRQSLDAVSSQKIGLSGFPLFNDSYEGSYVSWEARVNWMFPELYLASYSLKISGKSLR
jgi:hypothetical protein